MSSLKKTVLAALGLASALPLLVVAQTTDTVAPSVPSNIVAIVNSSSEVDLSWSASSDNVGVAGYKIYRGIGQNADTPQVATSTSASYQDTGLTPATTYVYMLAAYDAAGNVSAKSDPVPAATQSPPLGSTGSSGGNAGTSGGTSGTPSSGGSQLPAPGQASTPYQFQRQGIFDCNQNGSYAMSVGALGAIGGAYVPVADAAVELNTGTLVYKECVLREVVDREREAATSAFLKKGYTGIQTGRNGNPLYPQKPAQELLTYVSDPEILAFLKDGTLANLKPNLQGPITRAIARNYQVSTRQPATILKCPYSDHSPSVWDSVRAIGTSCNPIIAYYNAAELRGVRDAVARQVQLDQWNWNNGYYSVTDNPQDPLDRKILTPGINVQQSFQALLDSPVHQLESANDIGQMISALYAGVSTQIISDTQGLAGLSQSNGGQPSYLDQVAKESAQGVRNAAVNAALQILNAAQQVEATYLQTVESIASTLTNTINQLRSAERQCWALIIPKVCATALAADNTCFAPTSNCTDSGDGTATCAVGTFSKTAPITSCTVSQNPLAITCPVGFKLKVVTSVAFSQAVIDPQIAPLATTTLANIDKSQKAIQLITNLITGVTNTASLDAQRLSLNQLDALVAQHALHTQPDLVVVSQQKDSVSAAMSELVLATVGDSNHASGWTTSQDPSVGWCNINNPSVIQMWIQKWKLPNQ